VTHPEGPTLLDVFLEHMRAREAGAPEAPPPTMTDWLLGRRPFPFFPMRTLVVGALGLLAYAAHSAAEERRAATPRLLTAKQLGEALAGAEGGPAGYANVVTWFNASPEKRARLEALGPQAVAAWRAMRTRRGPLRSRRRR